jgi:ketosteroid isomerase-like protein
MSENADLVLEIFRAVERRDRERLFDLYHPEIEFVEAPSLPYGGTFRGLEEARREAVGDPQGSTWLDTWGPLQPTEKERSMDPRVVAENHEEVVVLYRQRAVEPGGERFDNPVLGLYRLRDSRLARAQMFHFDTAALVSFLDRAANRA